MRSKIQDKIKSVDELAGILDNLKKSGKKIVQCHGVFDLIHPGHIKHLESAKKQGDILVVSLTRDKYVRKGPGRPVFIEALRTETMASLEIVDYVCLSDGYTATKCIKILKPDLYAKGQDYRDRSQDITGKIFEEEEAVRSVNGKIYFTNDIAFSSSGLINRFSEVYPPETRDYLERISDKYPSDFIIDKLKSLSELKVLVIGDTIIDEYHYCDFMGESPKAHLAVSKYLSEEAFAGGTLAVTNHIAGLCREVQLVTLLGKSDSKEDFISEHLRPNIEAKFFYNDNSITTIKQRFVHQTLSQRLLEVYYINNGYLPKQCEDEIHRYLESTLPNFDMVLVADYGHGFLTKTLIETISENAKALAVTVQTNSANIGFNLITKYHGLNYGCLNEPEIRLAAGDRYGEIRDIIERVSNEIKSDTLIITRGREGSIGFSQDIGFHVAPALAPKVVDTIGASDAFFSITSPCLAAGMPLDLVSFIGNAVGALAVQIVCNRQPVDPINLYKFIDTVLK